MEMQFCNKVGLPHSAFMEWSDDDRGKALGFLIEESLVCPSCGTSDWQWEADRGAFVTVEHRCPGCYLIESASKASKDVPGTTWRLAPSKGPDAEERRATALAWAERRRQERELGLSEED